MNGIKSVLAIIAVLIGLATLAAPADAAVELTLEQRLEQALLDEYHAQAFYGAVLEQYGVIRPFSNIIRAEERHINALLALYDTFGWQAPANPYTPADFEFGSLEEAAQQAIDAEAANAGLYNELFDGLRDPRVNKVFTNLQRASQESHLPALQRFVNGECDGAAIQGQRNKNGNGNGNGKGNGKGKGKGKGKGNGSGGCRR